MKKIIAFVLTLCMILTMVCGCSVSDEDTLSTENTWHQGESSNPDQDTTEKENDQPVSGETVDVTIAETVIHDENGIKVTVTGIDMDGFMGAELKILVENNTERNIAYSGNSFVVNGITVSGYVYVDVAAGKKSNDAIVLYNEDLEIAGIKQIAAVAGGDVSIVDTDSYETLCEAPFAIETSIAANYVQAVDETGDVIFQQDGVTVIAKMISDDWLGMSVILLAKNETGRDIVLQADNVSVNGFTIDAWMHEIIYADTVCFCQLDLLSTSLEENGIEEVEDVTFTLSAIDAGSYSQITQSEELQIFVTK